MNEFSGGEVLGIRGTGTPSALVSQGDLGSIPSCWTFLEASHNLEHLAALCTIPRGLPVLLAL